MNRVAVSDGTTPESNSSRVWDNVHSRVANGSQSRPGAQAGTRQDSGRRAGDEAKRKTGMGSLTLWRREEAAVAQLLFQHRDASRRFSLGAVVDRYRRCRIGEGPAVARVLEVATVER